MKKFKLTLVAVLALLAQAAFAQSSVSALIARIEAMPCAKVNFVYTYTMPERTPMSINGVVEIQGESYMVRTADGSIFCSDGVTLWHLYNGELVINKAGGDSPYQNIKGFIQKSTLSTASNGSKVLTSADPKGGQHRLEIKSLESTSSKAADYFIMDADSLGDDVYVNDLR